MNIYLPQFEILKNIVYIIIIVTIKRMSRCLEIPVPFNRSTKYVLNMKSFVLLSVILVSGLLPWIRTSNNTVYYCRSLFNVLKQCLAICLMSAASPVQRILSNSYG